MAASDHLSPAQFYHASPHSFRVGDMVEPGHARVSGTEGRATDPDADKKVYFSDDLAAAKSFGSHVYDVEPTGGFAPDRHFPPTPPGHAPRLGAGEVMGRGFGGANGYGKATAYETESPLRVTGVRLARKTKKLSYNP
jgi:hypothetical protein